MHWVTFLSDCRQGNIPLIYQSEFLFLAQQGLIIRRTPEEKNKLMRSIMFILLAGLSITHFSCKKGYTEPYSQALLDSTHVLQTITWKIQTTQPSPFDLMENTPLMDTGTYIYNRIVGNPDFLQNYNSGFLFSPFGTGFGFNLGNFISIIYDAVPQFPASFEAGKVYENTLGFAPSSPMLVSPTHDDYKGDHYFTDTVPPDGLKPTDPEPERAGYCKILIDKKYVYHTQEGDMKMMDGTISGYIKISYGLNDTTKYVQRRDFTVSFTSMHFYQN
jgi:hypothetical protein